MTALAEARERDGLSVDELAAKTGIPAGMIERAEVGDRQLSEHQRGILAAALSRTCALFV